MSRPSLEERVTVLEKQVGALLASREVKRGLKDWRRTIGAFTGDDLMKQVFEEGRKIRNADRKRTKPRTAKKPQAHS
jgi:hypothetical protein